MAARNLAHEPIRLLRESHRRNETPVFLSAGLGRMVRVSTALGLVRLPFLAAFV